MAYWAGSFNARDLAGTPVASAAVRPRRLFRSGKPEAWTPEGWRQAASDGVRRIIDLRDPSEPRQAATGFEDAGIDYEFMPVDDPQDEEFRELMVPYMMHTDQYRDFLRIFDDRVARAVGRVVEAGPGTVVCCSAGRDRTGLVTGILFAALGADLDTLLAADRLATRTINRRHLQVTHPYEFYRPEPELSELVASRAEALREFYGQFDAAQWLEERGVDAQRAREWLLTQ